LKTRYPFFIKKLEHPTIDVEEDSGLMLVSRLPFLTLPNGQDHWYKPFPKAAGNDAMSAKGVGIVRVAGPYSSTTIAFTHLQASYDAANTEHADVRREQLQFIRDALYDLAAGNTQAYANSVIVGDFNIKGDPDDQSGEWNAVFANTPGALGGDFVDQWRAEMHPPGDNRDHDPGYTHRDTPSFTLNRLDYQLGRRGANADIGLIAHHMCVPFVLPSEITDHWPLYAHHHKISTHCSPGRALDLLQAAPTNAGAPGSHLWQLKTDFREEDMYHWVFVRDAGTYSIWTDPDLEVHAFRYDNFSAALNPSDTLARSELPDSVRLIMGREARLLERGEVFSWRDPFYLRIRGRLASVLGQHPYAIVRHRGESPATAIELLPHSPTNPGLPLNQPLGTDDKCWFRAERADRYDQTPYNDTFVVNNPDGLRIDVALLDAGQQPVPDGAAGTQAEIVASRNGSAERIYLVLRRASFDSANVAVIWRSALTYLSLGEELRLRLDDETGPDWPGADELELQVTVDTDTIYYDVWDDADAGEDWPNLVQSMRTNATARQGHGRWVAFTESVLFDTLKTDGVFAHGSAMGIIAPLGEYDKDVESRIAGITVKDPVGDGHLTAHVLLSRYPLT
jgi:hypothetical protein